MCRCVLRRCSGSLSQLRTSIRCGQQDNHRLLLFGLFLMAPSKDLNTLNRRTSGVIPHMDLDPLIYLIFLLLLLRLQLVFEGLREALFKDFLLVTFGYLPSFAPLSFFFMYSHLTLTCVFSSLVFIMNSQNDRSSGQNHGVIDVDKRQETPGFQCQICLAYTINASLASRHEENCRANRLLSQLAFTPYLKRGDFLGNHLSNGR